MNNKQTFLRLVGVGLSGLLILVSFVSVLDAYSSPGEKIPDHLAHQLCKEFKQAEKNLFDAHMILKAKKQIKLSSKQEQKIEPIVMRFKEFTIRQSAEIKISELRFAAFMKSDSFDKKEMAKHMRQIGKQKTQWVVTYINYLLDLREILTPEQRNILKNMDCKYTKKREQRLPSGALAANPI